MEYYSGAALVVAVATAAGLTAVLRPLVYKATDRLVDWIIATVTGKPPLGREISRGEESLSVTIRRLSDALASAAGTIHQIEAEVSRRQALVEQLEKQRQIAEQAVTLSREQVDAVAQLVSLSVKTEGTRTVLIGAAFTITTAVIFFILGVVVSMALS